MDLRNGCSHPSRQLLVKAIVGAQISSLLPAAQVDKEPAEQTRFPGTALGERRAGRDQAVAIPLLVSRPLRPAGPLTYLFLYVSSAQMTNRTKDHPPTRYLPPWPLGRGQERAPERLLVCREHPQRAGRLTTGPVAGKSPVGSTPPLPRPGPLSSPLGLVEDEAVGFLSFSLRTAKLKENQKQPVLRKGEPGLVPFPT